MQHETRKGDILLYQRQEDHMPEPALLIQGYADCITIAQEGRYININYETLKDFITSLNIIRKQKK